MRRLPIPELLASADHGPDFVRCRASLPTVVADLAERWSLRVGDPFQPGGVTAWVAPALDPTGSELVVKVGWSHPEASGEADGLRVWNGDGTVRLHASIHLEHTTALLLERATPGTPLSTFPEAEQDRVIAGLLTRLWITPPSHGLPPLAAMCASWADESATKLDADPHGLDPSMIRDGLDLFRTLPTGAERHVLLCTDLHAGNVLAAGREPWLVIDPKPHVGDPTFDALQHLLNCRARLRTDPDRLVRRMAGLLDIDADRLRLWAFARCIQETPHWPDLADVARNLRPS